MTNKKKMIENIVDLDIIDKINNKFYILLKNTENKQIKRYTYIAKNLEEMCYIIAKLNFLM